MKILMHFILCLACFGFTGCASIINGTRQEISVSTNPQDALVSDGETTVKSPCKLSLKRDKDHVLTITKPGFETESVRIVHVMSGAVAGNILAGGFIGWGVDAATGAQWKLEPETIAMSLRPVNDGEKVDESLRPTLGTLEAKLMELDRLKEKNLINEDEYKRMRDIAIQAVEPTAKLS